MDNLIRRNLSRTFYNRVQVQSLMFDGALEQIVGFNLTQYNRDDTNPEPFVPMEYRGQTRRVDWQANLLLTQDNTFSVGFNYLQEDAETTYNPFASQNNSGLFLMDQFSLSDLWFVTIGTRWDDWNTAGTANTYRWTNLLRVGDTGAAVHGSIGTGFRAPRWPRIYLPSAIPTCARNGAKVGTSGCVRRPGTGTWSSTAPISATILTDLIVFDFDTFRLENVGQARTTGSRAVGGLADGKRSFHPSRIHLYRPYESRYSETALSPSSKQSQPADRPSRVARPRTARSGTTLCRQSPRQQSGGVAVTTSC